MPAYPPSKQVKKGDGLGSQETRCREYANHKQYQVIEVFRDEGVSGSLINQPPWHAMQCSNFSRNTNTKTPWSSLMISAVLPETLEAHIQLRTAIGDAGGKLESPSIEFGEDSDSKLVENLLASVSQHHRQKNTEQVKNRMRARVLNGYWVFYPPIGYKYERVSGHGKMLVRDEPMASIIQEGLLGFASGRFESIAELTRFFDLYPEFPRMRNGKVNVQRVSDLLRRVLYSGYIDVPQWGISLHPAKHEPLISYEDFQRIQDAWTGAPKPR